jgi:hypothetical protein
MIVMKVVVMVIVAASSGSSSKDSNSNVRSSTLEKHKYAKVEKEVHT